MRVTVVGLGYVGLVTGACLAAWGHEVIGVDADPRRLGSLRAGSLPFHEPGLDDLVAIETTSGRLRFTEDIRTATSSADIVIIAVGTHDGNGGWQSDTIRACLTAIAPFMADHATLVVRSTMPPDFVPSLGSLVNGLRASAGRPALAVMSNPEFTREGRAIRDYQEPERVILGVAADPDGRGEAALRALYHRVSAPIIVMDVMDAALSKLGANLFLATKISFANELADLCDAYGADVTAVVEGMSYDGRIGGSFLKAGVGFGGSCLPNQVTMTVRTGAAAGVDLPLLAAVERVNTRRREEVVERAVILLDGALRGRKVALLGLTFKPDTDDLRDAPSLDIARGFLDAGAHVSAYDPMPTARERAAAAVEGLDVVGAVTDALRDADIAVLVTEWREFGELDWAAVGATMRRRIIIDGRNVLSGERLADSGFVYSSFGRGSVAPAGPEASSAAEAGIPVGISVGWGAP